MREEQEVFALAWKGGESIKRDADALQISSTLQLYDVFSSRIGKKKLLNLSGKLCSAEDWMQRWDTTQRF